MIPPAAERYFIPALVALVLLLLVHSQIAAQTDSPIKNANFETGMESWTLDSAEGLKHSLSQEKSFEGQSSLLIDSSQIDSSAADMVFLGFQRVDADSLKGKRIRFTGAARTEALMGPARLQLTLGCGEAGEGMLAMFNLKSSVLDDMSDRPIRNSDWEVYEIAADIPDNAVNVTFGWKMLGRGKAWIDDLKVDVVNSNADSTASQEDEAEDPMAQYADIMPLIQAASRKAHLEPQQPFFNHWLWVAAFSLGLFFVGSIRNTDSELLEGTIEPTQHNASLFWKFAFRFSVVYWLLFVFTIPVEGEFGKVALWANKYYKAAAEYLIYAVAENLFGIEGKLTPPLGSGDTTYSYIQVLVRFLASLGLATIWSLIDRRKTKYRIMSDLFLSYLRYALAATMLVYGLMKVQWSANQFPAIYPQRLDHTWGETSPMGVVWNFMGASRPYTVFAGLGELVGGLLLVFRRTSILGALATVGVMTNVVMLNYCYDVPVKILSTHLLVMALMILVSSFDAFRPMFFLKPTIPRSIKPPYYSPTSRWFYIPAKAAIVIVGFLMPCWNHFSTEIDHLAKHAHVPTWLGKYSVAEFRIDNEVVDLKSHPSSWKDVEFTQVDRWSQVDEKATCIMTLRAGQILLTDVGFIADGDDSFTFLPSERATLPQGECTINVVDERQIQLKGDTFAGTIDVLLKRKKSSDHRIYDRGFRWISEVPFNR